MPDAVRSAFLMAHIDDLGYAEIAARLRLSERTIKRHLVQAYAQCIMLIL